MNGPVRYLFRYIQRTFFLSVFADCLNEPELDNQIPSSKHFK